MPSSAQAPNLLGNISDVTNPGKWARKESKTVRVLDISILVENEMISVKETCK